MRLLDILLAEKEGNMKTNPWMIVSLLALACGFLLGSRVENEADAEAPKYQYYYNPSGQQPEERMLLRQTLRSEQFAQSRPMYVRVNLDTGEYEELSYYELPNQDGEKEPVMFWQKLRSVFAKYKREN